MEGVPSAEGSHQRRAGVSCKEGVSPAEVGVSPAESRGLTLRGHLIRAGDLILRGLESHLRKGSHP